MYEHINEIFILIPALLGLKGNLEMTLASRLSTAVSHKNLISSYIGRDYHWEKKLLHALIGEILIFCPVVVIICIKVDGDVYRKVARFDEKFSAVQCCKLVSSPV